MSIKYEIHYELDADDLQAIASLDTKRSLFFDHHDGDVTKCLWVGADI